MKKIKASLMGGTGYAAAELIKRLLMHPHVELLRISSIEQVGENIGKVHKNFGDRLHYKLENLTAEETARDCDVVFLALPHKVSYTKVPELLPLGVKIIDFSGDYRTRDVSVYNKYYATSHTNPENLSKFVYGLPEVNREQIKNAKYIANPGCFPTGVALSMAPLAKSGLLNNVKIRVIAATGSSGSGVAPGEGTHHPTRSLNMKIYKPLVHQHLPEMEQTLLDAGAKNISIDFIPISAPLSRGMLTNIVVDLPPHLSEKDVENIYREYYKGQAFVRLTGTKNMPEVIAVAGTNFVELGWYLREERNGTKSFAVSSAFDNLVKGAAGQAVQNMNLMFGFDETTALDDFGSWP
ncbi:MAG: N-acetyl-gamma-glutamyl-phosphate reductase [Oligoflexia bacterium]|nr:N-acetyl-gamma-glutamyl-phosphate reductase [Oligoflexia bacterium]MBF0367346.1 N-acetyl-gamma-glutamyl-phosphate reductase [Oligoflexia bacterium]